MKEISVQDLKVLNEVQVGPMVSIYLSKETTVFEQKNLTDRWKEALLKAEYYLLKDYTRSFVNHFMQELNSASYIEKLSELGALDKGFVVFYSKEFSGYLRVQSPINDLVIVADSFHIKPLIRIKNNERGFFIVTMSSRAINVLIENEGHLLRLDSYRNEPGIDGKNRKSSQDFFLHAAGELNKLFSAYRLPVVLAGVKDHVGHMKKIVNQTMLLDEAIIGNVEKMKADELQARVFAILAPYYAKIEAGAMGELDLAIKRDRAVTYLEDIAVSAVYGKVKKLFVVENRFVWGSINNRTGEVNVTPRRVNAHDDDVLDDLCQLVLAKGGEVVVVKEIDHFKGHLAVAIVTDKSHLYDGVHYNMLA